MELGKSNLTVENPCPPPTQRAHSRQKKETWVALDFSPSKMLQRAPWLGFDQPNLLWYSFWPCEQNGWLCNAVIMPCYFCCTFPPENPELPNEIYHYIILYHIRSIKHNSTSSKKMSPGFSTSFFSPTSSKTRQSPPPKRPVARWRGTGHGHPPGDSIHVGLEKDGVTNLWSHQMGSGNVPAYSNPSIEQGWSLLLFYPATWPCPEMVYFLVHPPKFPQNCNVD